MESRRVLISPEELGIYLSCQQPTLAYNLPLLIPLGEKASLEACRKALDAICQAHPYLGMRLSMDKGDIVKEVGPIEYELKEECVDSIDREALVQPFELLNAPLFRFRFLKEGDKGYLFADFHHILMDGFSLTMFLREFASAYEGGKLTKESFDGIDDGLAKLAARSGESFKEDKAYFEQTFGALDVDSSLTQDKKDEGEHYSKIKIALPTLSDADIALALNEYGVRRSSFFLGAFGLTLGQATFAEEVFFLTVNNGRRPEAKNSYGMYVKTLPVYLSGLDKGSVGEYLQKTDAQQNDSIAHSAYSYSDLVSDFSVSAEVLFSYQGDYYYHTTLGGKDVEVEVLPVKDGKEKMAIELFRLENRYFAEVEYRSDLYEEDTIRALLRRFEHFVGELRNKSTLEEIEPCDAEDAQILRGFNEKDLSEYDLSRDFVDDIRDHIAAHPDKPALIAGARTVTYGELGQLSDAIADLLIQKGFKADDIVSIMIGRNEFMGIASLGVLKAGLAYQPIDPGYPDERISFMMEDAEAKFLICDRFLKERIPSTYKGAVLFTDEIDALPHLGLTQPKPKPNDLYIMLYTSGSTGKPKGVQLEHHNLSAYVQWQRRFYNIEETSRWFAYASFGFDANMFDLYGALTNGCTLYVIDEEMRLDLKRLNEFIEEHKLTHGLMTTQVGRQFVEDYDNHSLQQLTVGGEKLVPVEPRETFRLVNGYGPTECTITITSYPVDKMYYRVPIGPGYPINHLFVLDKKMRPLPYGVPGYLYCAGPQVSRGYKNRPEENAKAFLTSPFEDGIWSKMYFTGDVVRFLKDGTVDFIGRKDGQVKIRGFRIEMSEVERVIRDFSGVHEATVNAYPAASGGSYLVGYVTADKQLDLDAIKAFIGERKPYYMIPEVMMQLDAIPLNQNGKVNKRALPLPKRKEMEVVLPENDTEKSLAEVAEKVLGYGPIGVTADLFEAGLTSISSIKFITLVSDALGDDVTVAKLKENPTIRQLSKTFGDVEEETYEAQSDYPLTQTQEGIYVECMGHPGSTVYNIPLLYKLDKEVDIHRLIEAVKKAIDAHPYLKGHLMVDENGDPRMVPALSNEVNVEVVEGLPRPFKLQAYDLMKGPFYQARIHKDGTDTYFFLDTHHIASDGTALAVLMEDIETAYKGEEIPAEKRDGFAIALKEVAEATKQAKEAQKAFYASFLEGVDSPSLPRKEYDLPKEEVPCEADHKLGVDKKLVHKFLKKNNLNLNGFYTAVFAYTLAKWNDNEDALFTSIYSGRDSSFTARSMTMMVKTLPVYAKFELDTLVLDFIRAVSKQLEESQRNTLFSFADVSREFGVKADVMFAYQGDGFLPSQVGGHKAELIHLSGDEVKALFSVDCVEDPDAFRLHFEYPSNLYREETMLYFSRLFDCVARGFLHDEKLTDIVLCDEASAADLDQYNQTDDPPYDGTYVDMFFEQAHKQPKKLAVIGPDESLTFEEMGKRMNKVANAMAKLGVKKDDKILVMVPRIANAYVAREGVLVSGASFVPVDPAYPDERILYIYEDSEAKAVLTTRALFEQKKGAFKEANFIILEDVLDKESDAFKRSKIDGDALAYCIYTSGSTGKPKGVMIEHHSLANLCHYTDHNYVAHEYVDYCHVCISLASLSFDLSIQEEFIPLANGMSIVIASEDEILNPVQLAKKMIDNGVDILTTTPSYVNNVLDIEEVMVAFRSLKVIDLGAEALPASMIHKMRERGMNCYVQNGYGPTEATVTCTMDRVESDRITIGFPDNNVKTYIVDKQLRRLPMGAMGELLIGGEGVARGYIHRDDLTKEKFVHFNGVYAYRSGDLSRMNYDGRIEFFGRKDNQVKLRGLRVELDEIENAMQTVPGISRSVVIVAETKQEGQFLVGYYLSKEEIPAEVIKEHIGKTLTPYMIPKVFMHLDTIPMTNNGKVNKKALPEPTITASNSKRAVRLPRNDTQKAIYEIFQHVLGVEELSIDDDFFDLGGTSLSASKVTMLAMGKGINISYSDVFDNPTVIDLAALAMHGGLAEEKKAEEVAKIEEGLDHNTLQFVDEIPQNLTEFKQILLTGCTGFLGIHILRELLEHSDANVVALARGNKAIPAQDRLHGLLEYYFDSPYEEEFARRVQVVESDVTSETLLKDLEGVNFDLIINCAALVKHFSADDAIERVNLGGVKNLIEVALAHHVRLVQVSTLSVAGENVNGKFPPEKRIHESEIFFGQDVSNKYINSKIKAEEAIIEAVNKRGLDGKIVRVGNLMGRARDGEFQVNSGTNNFMATIRAYKKLGVFPVSAADSTIDFSPIDEVAKTILLLAKTDARFTIFHSANSHEIELGDVIAAMNAFGFPIKMVDDATFTDAMNEYMKDESRQMDVSCLISYNSSDAVAREYILSDNTFTIKALYRLGYKWPITDESYLDRSIASLSTLGFFE